MKGICSRTRDAHKMLGYSELEEMPMDFKPLKIVAGHGGLGL